MKAHVFTNILGLKNKADYKNAKSGNAYSAFRLVNEILSVPKAQSLVDSLPEGTHIVPVYAVEKAGINQIPHAMSLILAEMAGDRYVYADTGIIMNNKVNHTGAGAMERLINKPYFEGTVWPGENYFIVDDVATSGSSLNELKNYIEGEGGNVIGCACLAASFTPLYGHGSQIGMNEDTINEMQQKFNTIELNDIINNYGYKEYRELTNSQGKYIASFKSLDSFREAIAEAEHKRIANDLQNAAAFRENQKEKGIGPDLEISS